MKGIYIIYNLKNGKSYIGQSVDIEQRWKQHLSSDLQYPLYKAFKKYGKENFSFEVLEECDDLSDKEMYWYETIKPEYNQLSPDLVTYNPASNPVLKINKNLEIVAEYSSGSEAARVNNYSISAINNVCNGKKITYKGFYWVFKKDYTADWTPREKSRISKPVMKINKNGESFIYNSLYQAGKENNLTAQMIKEMCSGLYKIGEDNWRFI